MEEYSDRRSKTEIAFLRRGSRISSTNQTPEERTNHQSYRPGSSTRLNPMKMGMDNNQERPRYLSDSFKSSSSKVATAGSSKFPLRKFEEKRKQPLLARVDIAESSRRKADAKHLDNNSKKVIVEDENSDALQPEPEDFTTEQGHLLAPGPEGSHFAGPSGVSAHTVESLVRSASSSSRTHRQKDKHVNLGTPGACSLSLTNRSTIPGNSAIGLKPSYGYVSGVQRSGLRNFASTSVPDVQPSGFPSASIHNRRSEAMRKRASDGEGSSRSRSLTGPVSLGHSPPTYLCDTGPRVRTTERPLPQQIIRGSSRNHQDSAVSVRTRRSCPQDTRLRVSEQREDRMLSLHDLSARNQQSDQSHFSFEEVSSERAIRPFSVELPHEIYSTSHRGLNTRTAGRRQSSLIEESPPQMFHGFLGESDSHRHITMEGITEVVS
uniref:Uncharacterized protein n=1 Tax=Arundo donax TaxID=35708 RepID=A0A0A9DLZ7_ARUDO